MSHTTDDVRICSLQPLISPANLIAEIPLNKKATELIIQTRQQASEIIRGYDDRLLVIVGPCSIHDVDAALEYAVLLQKAKNKFADELCLIMRVYFEKPRTTVGWKGLINDPYLNNSFNINQGLQLARKLLTNLADLGVPAGTEFLDTIVPQFLSDAISWGAIGARTTESQVHRELASGLSMPVGFKNGTEGNVQTALDAIYSAQHPHHFLSVTKQGYAAIVSTKGNDSCHIILRGSTQSTNYSSEHITQVSDALAVNQLNPGIMVDCSHGNSQKDHTRQVNVANDLISQLCRGNQVITGIMIESNLLAGKQKLIPGEKLCYGQSITDACLGWNETLDVLENLARGVAARRNLLKKSRRRLVNE